MDSKFILAKVPLYKETINFFIRNRCYYHKKYISKEEVIRKRGYSKYRNMLKIRINITINIP